RGKGGLRSILCTQAVTSMSLKGKTLFITGASRGIGLAIALRAARDGANIAIAAKTETPHPKLEGTINSAAEAIEQAGGQALPLVVDVRDEAAVKSAIAQTVTRFGSLDIVVNNASAISLTPVAQTDMKRFDLMHQINARGTFMVSKHAIAHLIFEAGQELHRLVPDRRYVPRRRRRHRFRHLPRRSEPAAIAGFLRRGSSKPPPGVSLAAKASPSREFRKNLQLDLADRHASLYWCGFQRPLE